jgi:Holliday junction DNA helicase RuvA
MITSLRGLLLESAIFRAVVECGGIGYEVHIPVTTSEQLPRPGAEVRLHIHQVIREDDNSLYGFATADERDFFRTLVEKVSGIGPKTALNIFSKLSLNVLKDAIARGDIKLLSGCPGIGKRTAERLIIELRDKILPGTTALPVAPGTAATNPDGSPAAAEAAANAAAATIQNDAVAALVSLGLKPTDADKSVRTALLKLGSSPTIETLIRTALGNS